MKKTEHKRESKNSYRTFPKIWTYSDFPVGSGGEDVRERRRREEVKEKNRERGGGGRKRERRMRKGKRQGSKEKK